MISQCDITGIEDSYVYKRAEITPTLSVCYGNDNLLLNQDFTIEYKDNDTIGTASVIISGKGFYKGCIVKTFEIVECDHLWGNSITIKEVGCFEPGERKLTCYICEDTMFKDIAPRGHSYGADRVCDRCGYDDTAVILPSLDTQPETDTDPDLIPSTKLEDDMEKPSSSDSTEEITSVPSVPSPMPTPENHQCSFAAVKTPATTTKDGKVEMKCACGAVASKKVIYKASGVKLKLKLYTYNGKVKSPTVIVKDSKGKALKKGTDYIVSTPKGRKNVGKYTYTIKFKGSYSGTKKLTLTIKPANPTIKAPKAAKKAVTVKWKNVSKQATGYQVMIAADKKFTKNVKKSFVTKARTTSKKFTKLKSKKTYYVKVRTYKTVKVNGKATKIYSNWSKVKSCKTK